MANNIVYCNVGWMRKYDGLSVDDSMKYGGSYNKDNIGHEINNFTLIGDKYYGYVQPPGSAYTINVSAHFDNVVDDSYADNVLVVWTARSDDKGRVITGFYKDARVFRHIQNLDDATAEYRYYSDYNIVSSDAVLIAPQDRTFKVMGMGQSNVWYGNEEINNEVLKYIENYNDTEPSLWIIPASLDTYLTDDAFRNKVVIDWRQSKNVINIKTGDTVYVYIGKPVQEIHWKCVVRKVKKKTSTIEDDEYYVKPLEPARYYMELEAVHEYSCPELLSYDELLKNGLKGRIQGGQRAKDQLAAYLKYVDSLESASSKKQVYLNQISTDDLKELAEKHSGKAKKSLPTPTSTFVRSPYISDYAKRRAKGVCQLCGKEAPFNDLKGKPYLESHHVIWLSQGGEDSIYNTVALCPNCHKKMHILNDANDIEILLNTIKQK